MLFIIDLRPGFRNSQTSPDQNVRSQGQSASNALDPQAQESISLPKAIPYETTGTIHSAESILRKYPPTRIGDTLIITDPVVMTSALEGSAGTGNHGVCKVTLVGPADPAPAFSLFNPRTWRAPQDNRVELEMQIGSEECTDWDHANRCLGGIRLLIMSQGGYLNDTVTEALCEHLGAKVSSSKGESEN